MRNTLLITRLLISQIIASANPFTGVYESQQKRSRAIFRAIGVIALLLMGCGSIIFLEYTIYTTLSDIHQPMILPGLAVLVGMMSTLMLGFFQGLSELYQSKDSVFLAVLPVTSRQIFFARLAAMYFSELALNLLLMGPAFVMYAIGMGTAWPYALTGLLVFLLTPLIPLAIVAAIASLLMRISGFARHRETVAMALSLALALGYSFVMTRINSGRNSDEDMQAFILLLTQENGLVYRLLGLFPPARWAMEAFSGGWGSLLLLAGVSVGCVALVWFLFGEGYLPLALSLGEVSAAPRKSGRSDWRAVSGFAALHRLEWRMLLRTPAWTMNSLVGLIIFPLMTTVGFVSGFAGAEVAAGSIMGFLLDAIHPAYVVMGCAALLSMITMINPACATAVSREGGNWPFALTLPAKQSTRLLAKLAQGEEINLIGTLLMCIPLILFGSPWWLILLSFVSGNLVGLAAAAASLALDAFHPQLKWTNEVQAIKKNYHTLLGMAIWAALIALCVVFIVVLPGKPLIAALCSAALILAATALGCFLLGRAARISTVD